MSLNSNDLATLRGANLSDDQILDGLYHTSPSDQSDIDALKKGGLNSTQILNGFAQYDSSNQPQKSLLDTAGDFLKAPIYGTQQELGRAAETEQDLGADGAANAEQAAAQGLNTVTSGYDPASAHFEVTDPSTWSYAPRAALEGAPATGGYLGSAALGARLGAFLGPEGAIAGGLIGPMLYGLNRYLGTDAQSRAANDGRSNVTESDIVGALPGATAQAAIDTAGSRILANNALLKAAPVKGAGLSALGQTIGNVAKTAGADAVLGGLSDAAGQLGTSVGTDQGAQLNSATIENSAALSGATAGGLKALGAVPESLASYRFAAGDPQAKARIADLINSDRVAGDPNNPADNQRILDTTGDLLNAQAQQETNALKQAIREGQSQGADTSGLEGALRTASDLSANLDTGYPLDPGQIEQLTGNPSAPVSLANALADQSEFNRLKQTLSGSQDQEGAPSPLSALRSAMHARHLLGMAGIEAGVMAHNPLVGMGVLALPYALSAARRLGARAFSQDSLGDFMSRYSGLAKAQSGNLPIGGSAVASGPQNAPVSPAAPLTGELMSPDRPAGLLAAPPIYGSPSARMYGDGFTIEPGAFGYEGSGPSPQAAPQSLPAPLRALPAPTMVYGPEGGQSFRMRPVEADGAPNAPIEPTQADPTQVARQAVQTQRIMQPVGASVNEQADMIERALMRAQGVLNDPSASLEAKQMARAAKLKAVMAAANMQEATKGGTRDVKNPQFYTSEQAGGHLEPSKAPNAGETFDIKTPSGIRKQAIANVRHSRAGVVAGVLKREAARREILERAHSLPLTAEGHALLGYRLPHIASDLFHNANNRLEAAERLTDALSAFGPEDRARLKAHFEQALAENGSSLLGTWRNKGTRKRGEPRIEA